MRKRGNYVETIEIDTSESPPFSLRLITLYDIEQDYRSKTNTYTII